MPDDEDELDEQDEEDEDAPRPAQHRRGALSLPGIVAWLLRLALAPQTAFLPVRHRGRRRRR